MDEAPMPAGQVGRSLPRLEGARESHGPRRIHPQSAPARHAHTARSSAARVPHAPHQAHRCERRARRSRASTASSRSTTSGPSSPIPITGRPFTISRSSPTARCASPASRSRWCWPRIAHIAEEAAAPHRRRVRGIARRLRRGRGDDLASDRARGAEARRHVSRPEASARARAAPTSRSTFTCGAAIVDAAFAARRPCVRAHLPHAAGDAHAARAVRRGGRGGRRHDHDPHRLAEPVVRAHRDRAAPRLAREPRADQGAAISAAASARKLYIKLEALVDGAWRCSCAGR